MKTKINTLLAAVLALLVIITTSLSRGYAQGKLVSWGTDDDFGSVSGIPAGVFTAVAAGAGGLAIRTDGTLVSWANDWGTPAGTFTAIAASSTHRVAIRTDGTLISWGDDSLGQVSDTPSGTFKAIAAG
jgi:alpha-tubulin suppressor-like RCC1 family protein